MRTTSLTSDGQYRDRALYAQCSCIGDMALLLNRGTVSAAHSVQVLYSSNMARLINVIPDVQVRCQPLLRALQMPAKLLSTASCLQ